jgi:hypothetical protein
VVHLLKKHAAGEQATWPPSGPNFEGLGDAAKDRYVNDCLKQCVKHKPMSVLKETMVLDPQ